MISISIFSFDLANSEGQGQGHTHFDNEYLGSGNRCGGKNYNYHQIASHMSFSICSLHLTLAHFKGHGQCHAH